MTLITPNTCNIPNIFHIAHHPNTPNVLTPPRRHLDIASARLCHILCMCVCVCMLTYFCLHANDGIRESQLRSCLWTILEDWPQNIAVPWEKFTATVKMAPKRHMHIEAEKAVTHAEPNKLHHPVVLDSFEQRCGLFGSACVTAISASIGACPSCALWLKKMRWEGKKKKNPYNF